MTPQLASEFQEDLKSNDSYIASENTNYTPGYHDLIEGFGKEL